MAEPIERRSTRSKKPITHFNDKILQSSKPSKPSSTPKATITPTKATKSSAKPSIKLSIKLSIEPSTSTEPFTNPSTKPSTSDPIQQLCTQTEQLDIETNEKTASDKKTKKKAKIEKIAHLTKLNHRQKVAGAQPCSQPALLLNLLNLLRAAQSCSELLKLAQGLLKAIKI